MEWHSAIRPPGRRAPNQPGSSATTRKLFLDTGVDDAELRGTRNPDRNHYAIRALRVVRVYVGSKTARENWLSLCAEMGLFCRPVQVHWPLEAPRASDRSRRADDKRQRIHAARRLAYWNDATDHAAQGADEDPLWLERRAEWIGAEIVWMEVWGAGPAIAGLELAFRTGRGENTHPALRLIQELELAGNVRAPIVGTGRGQEKIRPRAGVKMPPPGHQDEIDNVATKARIVRQVANMEPEE